MFSSKKPKVFYGYWIVAVAFLCVTIASGCGFYAFSLFVRPLQADLGWSRGGIMAAHAIWFLLTGLAAPLVGRIVDRHGARGVITIGATMAGLGFIWLSLMTELWHYYAGYAVIGLGMSAMSQVPASAVVSNWFRKRRGLAIGIMSMGIGVGGLALAPLVGGYLIPSFGWRVSYLVLALIIWVFVIPLVLLVIKTKPAEMGLHPDGMETPEALASVKASLSANEGLTLRLALATPAFWFISIAFLASLFSQVGTIQNQVPYLEDFGFPVATVATALGGVGLVSAVAKFGFGWLCDWIPAKYAMFIGLSLQVSGIVVLLSVGSAMSPALIWLYVILIGLGSGSWLPTMSMITSTTFGLTAYGAIFGAITVFYAIGGATGPLMAGYLYDATNTYHGAFLVFTALYLIAIPAILVVRRPKSLI